MNYYEELGIRSDADEEEIRKAHRRLVKLMHPDQHRDQGLKQLAETQMRRLNSIVAVLLDPEERRDYDDQLRNGGVNGDGSGAPVPQSSWKSVPWWIASTLGAIILTVGTVWLLADRFGSHFQQPSSSLHVTEITPPATDTQPVTEPAPVVPDQKPAPALDEKTTAQQVPNVTPSQTPPVPVPQQQQPQQQTAQVIKQPPPEVTPVLVPRPVPAPPPTVKPAAPPKTAIVQARQSTPPPVKPFSDYRQPEVRPKIGSTEIGGAAPAPGVGSVPQGSEADYWREDSVPGPPPIGRRDPLEGEWVYAPLEPEKRRPGFYPPEFIRLKLVKDTDGMRGEYNARYSVDRQVSPDVNFVLKATDPTALKYSWTASNGAHGWAVIRNLEQDTMRIEWHDTSKGHGPALTSGEATLVRKN